MYVNSLLTFDGLKKNIHEEINSSTKEEFQRVPNNIFSRCRLVLMPWDNTSKTEVQISGRIYALEDQGKGLKSDKEVANQPLT